VTAPVPLPEEEIAARLAALPGWRRDGDEITRAFTHTYHECVHLAVYVAAKAREVSHHPDMIITWQRVEFRITTHDAGRRLTDADFSLAADIDSIAAAGGASPVWLGLSVPLVPDRSGAPCQPGKAAGRFHVRGLPGWRETARARVKTVLHGIARPGRERLRAAHRPSGRLPPCSGPESLSLLLPGCRGAWSGRGLGGS
jgi:4a-hydroxytetrahydrobiopterin dehydratase